MSRFERRYYEKSYKNKLQVCGFRLKKTSQIVSRGSRVSSSVIDPDVDFKMRKVERFAKQKIGSKNVA